MAPAYRRIAVKIGSNVLTRADGSLDITRMSALVDQVAELVACGVKVIVISSGAVASGRSQLNVAQSLDPVSARQLYSAVGQAKLMNRYYELFREHGLTCGQILTTKENFATRRHFLNQKHCMEVMLDNNVVPVVNENDTVSLTELMFTDNDELSGRIASMMDLDALILLSNIDGVYTGDPSLPGSQLITDIYPGDTMEACITESRSSHGRGGMTTKYRVATRMASEGITVIIANGKRDNALTGLVLGEPSVPHTTFHPAETSQSGVKKWIANSEDFAKGSVYINEGAFEAITSASRASLLPVGIIRVDGLFEEGDIVKVIGPDGNVVAWGRAAYDCRQAALSAGQRDVRPFIHSDYLYIDY